MYKLFEANRAVNGSLLIIGILLLTGCGAYFNTFYNTKKIFNEAEKKRIVQEEKRKKTGNSRTSRQPTKINEYSKAIEKGSKILELYPKSKYVDDALMIIGQSFYHTGDYIKAQRKFEELINLLPNSEFVPQARLWLGKTLIAQNDFSRARSVLNELVSQNSDKRLSGDAQMLLGELYFTQEDFQSAVKEFENTVSKVKNKEDKIQAQLRIGQCFIEQDNYQKAAESFYKGLQFKPDLEQKYLLELNYGQSLRQLEEYDQALNVFKKMTRGALTKGEQANIRLEIAETYSRMKEIEKARIELEDVIKDFPKTDQAAQAYYKLAQIYLREDGNFKEALKYLNLAQKEFGRSVLLDSIVFWQKNLQNWDKLNFELAVFQKAYQNVDFTTTDTIGTFLVQEKDEDSNPFDLPDLFGESDSTKIDSLKMAAIKDSIRADSLRKAGQNPNSNFQNDRSRENAISTQRNRTRSLSLNNPSGERGRENSRKRNTKVLKKVTVPKSPWKLKSKLIEDTNRMAELYMFQFGFPDSAIINYDFLLSSFPDHPSYPHWLYTSAFLMEKLGDQQTADSLKNEIINNYPDSRYAMQIQGKKEQLPEQKEEKNLFNLAEKYLFEKEMMDSSIYIYQKIVEEYPESELAPKSLYSLAYIYDWFKNDTSHALQNYRKLIAEYPSSDYAKAGQKKINAVKRYIAEAKRAAEKAAKDSLAKMNAKNVDSTKVKSKNIRRNKLAQAEEEIGLDEIGKAKTAGTSQVIKGISEFDDPPFPVGGLEAITKKLIYPAVARKKRIEGTTVLKVFVDEKGKVKEVSLIKSVGDKEYDQAAITAVKAVKWNPGIKDDQETGGLVEVPVKFTRRILLEEK